jgi:hypothetical protein
MRSMEIFGLPTMTVFLSGWTVELERRSDADVRPIELLQTQGEQNGVAIDFIGAVSVRRLSSPKKPRRIFNRRGAF